VDHHEYKAMIKTIEGLGSDVVIGEFAGRDSAAAIIKAMEEKDINHVLPMATFAPTEYGDFNSLKYNVKSTKKRVDEIHGNTKTVDDLVTYSNSDLWSVLNGRFAYSLREKYGFFSSCIGCHAYFHLVRIPFALQLGKRIISGERESHDGRIKINQLGPCLDLYQKITAYFGVQLLMPLRGMQEGRDVVDLLGWDWEEGGSQPACALSGNYSDTKGNVHYDLDALTYFLHEFLYPVAIDLGELIIENPKADRQTMLKAINKRMGEQ